MCRKSFNKIHNGITEHFSFVHFHHNGAALTGFLRTTKDSGKRKSDFSRPIFWHKPSTGLLPTQQIGLAGFLCNSFTGITQRTFQV